MNKIQLNHLFWCLVELAHAIEDEYEYGSIGQISMSYIASVARELKEENDKKGSE